MTTETGDGIFGVSRTVMRRGAMIGISRPRLPLYAERDVVPRSLARTKQLKDRSRKVKDRTLKRMYKEKDLDLF